MERLGCLSWLLLVVVCAALPRALGASQNVSLGIGLALATVITGTAAILHTRR